MISSIIFDSVLNFIFYSIRYFTGRYKILNKMSKYILFNSTYRLLLNEHIYIYIYVYRRWPSPLNIPTHFKQVALRVVKMLEKNPEKQFVICIYKFFASWLMVVVAQYLDKAASLQLYIYIYTYILILIINNNGRLISFLHHLSSAPISPDTLLN